MAKGPNPLKSVKKFQSVAKRPTGMAAIKFYLTLPFTAGGKLVKNWFTGRLSRRASFIMEFLSVAIIVGICILINVKMGLQSSLGGPAYLRSVWLGLVAFLVYLTIRLAVSMVRQIPETMSRFPDIQQALETGRELMADSQIEFRDVPCFLVLGATRAVENAIAGSGFVGTDVRFDPDDEPVHFYGDNDGVWISLPGVSAISLQSQRWDEKRDDESGKSSAERLSHAEKEEAYRRLCYTMKQLRGMRSGIIPVNGILLLIPFQWMNDPRNAKLLDTVKLDMFAAQTELGVKCECVILFHGIEREAEFRAYRDRFPGSVRQSRCGCTVPQFTEHSPVESAALHQWLFAFFRRQVYGFFAADVSRSDNTLLFRFLNLIERSKDGFCRVLNNAFSTDADSKVYLGGVYFVELSRAGRSFFDGVIAKLRSDHDDVVGWAPEMLKRDRRLSRLATAVAACAVSVVLADTVFIFQRLFGN